MASGPHAGESQAPRLPALTPRRQAPQDRAVAAGASTVDHGGEGGVIGYPTIDPVPIKTPRTSDALPKLAGAIARGDQTAPLELSQLQGLTNFRYPGNSSKRLPPKKTRKGGTPRGVVGVVADQHVTSVAYNSIDYGIAPQLDARLRQFVNYHEQVPIDEATGTYLLIERCHNCSVHHALSTRHDEFAYQKSCKELLEHISSVSRGVIADVGELLCELDPAPRSLGIDHSLGHDIWWHGSRVGAFEVYLLTPCSDSYSPGGILNYTSRNHASAQTLFSDASQTWKEEDAHSNMEGGMPQVEIGGKTWGAKLKLPSGFTATLLHSKLSSKSWPKEHQLLRRLQASLPMAVVTIRVLEPDCEPLSSFTVQLLADNGVPESELYGGGESRQPTKQLLGQAANGECQVRGIPPQAELTMRISHPTMRTQTVKLMVSRLRMSVTLGTDLFMRLWAEEVNGGGLAIYASHHEANARIPEKAKPFVGQLEFAKGGGPLEGNVDVEGHIILPWSGFSPEDGSSEHALPFAALQAIHASGYFSMEVSATKKKTKMGQLRKSECLLICTLSSPEAVLQVVTPDTNRPIPNVRVFLEADQNTNWTTEDGMCKLCLRPGLHKIKMQHTDVAIQWVERELHVDSMKPAFLIPLPLSFRVWQIPVAIRGRVLGWDVWATPEKEQPGPGWEPFGESICWHPDGEDSRPMTVKNGHGFIEAGAVQPLSAVARATGSSLLFHELSLEPPFVRKLDGVTSSGGGQSISDKGRGFMPRLLGTVGVVAGLQDFGSEQQPIEGIAFGVFARTRCCGMGVPGVQVAFSAAEGAGEQGDDAIPRAGVTNKQGELVVPVRQRAAFEVKLSHPGLIGGQVQYSVILNAIAADDSGGQLVGLPLLFDVQMYLCTVPAAAPTVTGGACPHTLMVMSSLSSLPKASQIFGGKMVGTAGMELQMPRPGESCSSSDDPLPLKMSLARLRQGTPCPVLQLEKLTAQEWGFDWSAVATAHSGPLSDFSCGLMRLLHNPAAKTRAAACVPVTLGTLKPFATVVCLNGSTLKLPLEDVSTAGSAMNYLEKSSSKLAVGALVADDSVEGGGFRMLGAEEPLFAGERLRALARLLVKVTLGHSDIGVPGADVSVAAVTRNDGIEAQAAVKAPLVMFPEVGATSANSATTSNSGEVELFADGTAKGPLTLVVRHGLFGGSCLRKVQVEVSEPVVKISVAIPLRLCVYRLDPQDGHPADPSTVWLACVPAGSAVLQGRSRLGDDKIAVTLSAAWAVPDGARAVPGVVQARGAVEDDVYEEVSLDRRTLQPVPLTFRGDGSSQELPIDGVAVRCDVEGLLWESAAPWILNSQAAWAALLEGPISVGQLWPAVNVRCHADLLRQGKTMLRLSAQKHQTAGAMKAALLAQDDIAPVGDIAIFQDEQLLLEEDVVNPRQAVDAWGLAAVDIRVVMRCCLLGLPGVNIQLGEDYLMNGNPASKRKRAPSKSTSGQDLQEASRSSKRSPSTDPPVQDGSAGRADRRGITADDGSCRIMANVGPHTIHLAHPLLQGDCVTADIWRSWSGGICISQPPLHLRASGAGSALALEVLVGPPLHVYRSLSSGTSHKVWLCARPEDAPEGTRPWTGGQGQLRVLPNHQSVKRIALDHGAATPAPACNSEPGHACPLLSFDVEAHDEQRRPLAWCRDAASFGARCLHAQCAHGAIELGSLRPAVTVQLDDSNDLRLPVDEFGTVHGLRVHLDEKLPSGPAADGVGVFNSKGHLMKDNVPLSAGMTLSAGLLYRWALHVFAPEGLMDADDVEGKDLTGVTVEVEGHERGRTEENGVLELSTRVGECNLRLVHPCFGDDGRIVQVHVSPEKTKEITVLSDIRVYIYALEIEDEDGGINGPSAGPTLVYVCADRDQIPDEAVGVVGKVRCTGIGGKQVEMQLDGGDFPHEFILARGADAEAANVSIACSLSSLELQVRRSGSAWRPKDPSPFLEREEELGPGEYLRLLGCPVSVGQLLPALRVDVVGSSRKHLDELQRLEDEVRRLEEQLYGFQRRTSMDSISTTKQLEEEVLALKHRIKEQMETMRRPPLELVAQDNSSLEQLKESVQDVLGTYEDIYFYVNGVLLREDAHIGAGMTIEAREVRPLTLRAVTGCCGDPLQDACVCLDDVKVGTVDKEGLCELSVPVGKHIIEVRKYKGESSGSDASVLSIKREVEVTLETGDDDGQMLFELSPKLLVYATDPEPDEDGSEQNLSRMCSPEDDADGAMFDGTCVWVAADPGDVPDDALPVDSCVVCCPREGGERQLLRARLHDDKVAAFELSLTADASSKAAERCVLRTLRLSCARRSFIWYPKDPSPMEARVDDIGGCELLRLFECPAAVGFLKPSVAVQFADNSVLRLPLETYNTVSLLRDRLAEHLSKGDPVKAAQAHPGVAQDGKRQRSKSTTFAPEEGLQAAQAHAGVAQHEQRKRSKSTTLPEGLQAINPSNLSLQMEDGRPLVSRLFPVPPPSVVFCARPREHVGVIRQASKAATGGVRRDAAIPDEANDDFEQWTQDALIVAGLEKINQVPPPR